MVHPLRYLLAFVLGGVVLISNAAPALAEASSSASSSSAAPIRVQLKWTHQFQFAGFYAALDQGYYKDAGLDVELAEATPSTDVIKEVVDGRAQYGVGTSELLLARATGAPVTVLAVIYQHSPLVLIALKGDKADSIRDVHDLAGKPIMMEKQAADIVAYLHNEGLDSSKIVAVPHTFNAQDLLDGKVAAMTAYSTDEPYRLRVQGHDYMEFTPRSGGVDFYGDSLFTSAKEMKDHPDRVRAFREATLRGWEYAMDHPDDVIDLILRQYAPKDSRDRLTFEAIETRRLMHPELIEIGYINPGRWKDIESVYRETGLLKPQDRVDYDAFLYHEKTGVDLREIYWLLAVFGAVTLGALLWLFPLLRLNQKLRREIQLRARTEQQLRRNEKQYKDLIELAPFPVLIADPKTLGILFANRRAVELLELPEPGSPAADKAGIRNFHAYAEDRDRIIAGTRGNRTLSDEEIACLTGRGRLIWTLVSAGGTEFDGRPALLVSLNEVTHRHQRELLLTQAKDAAESAVEAKSRYLAAMKQEVSAPLTGIIGLVRVVLQTSLPKEVRENLLLVEKAAESLVHLVTDLLDWSIAEDAQIEPPHTPIDLRTFTSELCALFRPAAEAKGLALEQSVDEGVPVSASVDPLRLRQILTSLVGNALTCTEQGKVTVSLQLGQTPEPGKTLLRFHVKDTGAAEASRENVFSVARALAQGMDGDLLVDSKSEGNLCVVTLLADVDGVAPAPAPPEEPSAN
ncbi:MAG TPA: ABC transporter substrate-binding protein [Candidatus Methylacidiphilales bacterium]